MILVGDISEIKVNSVIWIAVSLEEIDIQEGEKIIVNSIEGK